MKFDSSGKYEGAVGRSGAGPGEFRRLNVLFVDSDDTVHAFDIALKRHSVLSVPEGKVIRQARWESFNSQILQLPDGQFIAAGDAGAGAPMGRPYELIAKDGSVIRSFGGSNRTHLRWMNPWLVKTLAADGSGGFFSVGMLDYAIEHWSADGRLLGSWQLDADWFPHSAPSLKARPQIGEGLLPVTWASWTDSLGNLYVLSHVLQKDWKKSLIRTRADGRIVEDYSDPNEYFDSIIDVYDSRSMRLLASNRFDQYFWGRAGSERLHTKGSEPSDFIDVWRVRLVRP